MLSFMEKQIHRRQLFHDLDFEKYPEEHCIKEQEIMRERGVDERIAQTIETLKTFRP